MFLMMIVRSDDSLDYKDDRHEYKIRWVLDDDDRLMVIVQSKTV
jgi:hypothetical protein